jgi:hypothetical protein
MNFIRKAAVSAAVVATTFTGGAIGAALMNGTANAQTDSSTSTTTVDSGSSTTTDNNNSTTTDQQQTQPPQSDRGGRGYDPRQGGHQANGITEEILTGDAADQVTAAAKAAVPDGTIDRVETDAEGSPYEAHVTKADGSHVTVKINSDFSVASIEAAMR